MNASLDSLLSAQRALRSRFDDFRRALDRRDEAAYRMALADFHACLQHWTEAEERSLMPALTRVEIPGRDPQRELRLEYVQLRELTRHVRLEIDTGARMADVLGFVQNLERRLTAHEAEMEKVYYPAAARVLTPEERRVLEEAAPPD
ncbi:MAG TPA: hemerythrin domain-containing protein [Thermoanaerobaculia bacterium]